MSDKVSWILTLKVKPGELEGFRDLMKEMVAHTRNEPGTLAYEWFVSADGESVHLYERYADSDAALAHMEGFAVHFARRFTAATEPTAWYVYGNADTKLRNALGAMDVEFLAPFGGFER